MTVSAFKRTARSAVLVASVVVLAPFAACSTNAPQPTTQHQTYTYNYMSSPSNDHWKPRQQISITWTPRAGQMTNDAAPEHVALAATFRPVYVGQRPEGRDERHCSNCRERLAHRDRH